MQLFAMFLPVYHPITRGTPLPPLLWVCSTKFGAFVVTVRTEKTRFGRPRNEAIFHQWDRGRC